MPGVAMNAYRGSGPEHRLLIEQMVRGLYRRVREDTLLRFDRWLALFDAAARDDTVVRQIYMPS